MNTLTEIDKALLAGLIDGEGCIAITRYKPKNGVSWSYNLVVVISMTDENIIRIWHEKTGIGSVACQRRSGNKRMYRDIWQWQIHKYEAISLLSAIGNRLVVKQDQAGVAIEFSKLETRRSGRYGRVTEEINQRREEFYNILRMMKKTPGDADPTAPYSPRGVGIAQGRLF
jgi:hypothetical protein